MRTIPTILVTILLFLSPSQLKAKPAPKTNQAAGAIHPRVIMKTDKVRGLYYSPPPQYPKEAIKKHLGGSGLFEVQFQRDGRVRAVFVTLSTGYKVLDDAAVVTLHQWRSWKGYKLIVAAVPIAFDPADEKKPISAPK